MQPQQTLPKMNHSVTYARWVYNMQHTCNTYYLYEHEQCNGPWTLKDFFRSKEIPIPIPEIFQQKARQSEVVNKGIRSQF